VWGGASRNAPVRRVLLLAALLLVPGTHAAPLGGSERAFVAAEAENRIVAIDLDSSRVVARMRVPNGPHNVAVSPSRRLIVVTSPPAGAVTLVDALSARVVKSLRGFSHPHDVEFAPDGRFAYVTEERRGTVAVISVTTRRTIRRVSVGPGPHDLAVSPDGKQVWVTHGARDARVTILDTRRPSSARAAARASAGGAPHDITFACRGDRVWITYWNSGMLGALDTFSRRLLFRERGGALVHHVQSYADGNHIWITDHTANRARMLYGCVAGRILRTLPVGAGPHHVAIGPLRGRVIVASHDSGTITVLDPAEKRIRTIGVGRGLHGVAVAVVP
jgi:YVTN family beta-propeller protein